MDQHEFDSTDSPRLPKIVSGSRYLDVSPDSTLGDIRNLTRNLPIEVLSVFNQDGRLLFAPLIGQEGSVYIAPFAARLKDRVVVHNHPRGGMLSDRDLVEAIECDVARIEAVCPDGTILAWNRPASGWPDAGVAKRAYVSGFNRAFKAYSALLGRRQMMSAIQFREEVLKQVDRTLGNTKAFGRGALRVERSAVD